MTAAQIMHAALTKMAADGNVEAAFTLELVKQTGASSRDAVVSILKAAHKELGDLQLGKPACFTVQIAQNQIVTAIGMM